MREDMAKVLVERPRRGSSLPNLRVTAERAQSTSRAKDFEALDDMPRTDPMRRFNWSQGLHKEFSDNLNPLRRFLKSSVGRLWDDVYSELREYVNPGSTIQNHIMQHLWHYVELDVIIDDKGDPWEHKGHGGGYEPMYKSRYNSGFYVHPISKKLLEPPAAPKRPQRMPYGYNPNAHEDKDGSKFFKHNGCWGKIVLVSKGFANDERIQYSQDQFGYIYRYTVPIPGTWEERFKPIWQQLSKKELKKYGLQNG